MPRPVDEFVGLTSTIPVEVVFAAGRIPTDLNNRFINAERPLQLVAEAEQSGLPRNLCSWVKGIHSAVRLSGIQTVVGVVQGDCAYLSTLLDVFGMEGIRFIPFAFPHGKNRYLLRFEIENLMQQFGVQWDQVKSAKRRLDTVRALAHEIDRRTYRDGLFSGRDNFETLVNCSDFKGDPERFGEELERLLASSTEPLPPPRLRLGLIGVPGMITDLFETLETFGARVLFNEVPRQFAMPVFSEDLLAQYTAYTYPYSLADRVEDIRQEAQRRNLDGMIHYVQSFCHHQLEDAVLRRTLDVPLLTLEGDQPGFLDARSRTRIEAFLELLEPPAAARRGA